jgi:hypothetical protein
LEITYKDWDKFDHWRWGSEQEGVEQYDWILVD